MLTWREVTYVSSYFFTSWVLAILQHSRLILSCNGCGICKWLCISHSPQNNFSRTDVCLVYLDLYQSIHYSHPPRLMTETKEAAYPRISVRFSSPIMDTNTLVCQKNQHSVTLMLRLNQIKSHWVSARIKYSHAAQVPLYGVSPTYLLQKNEGLENKVAHRK